MDLVLAALVGLASALVPVVNAEAYVMVRVGMGASAAGSALALAVGQTAGKALLVELARRGSQRPAVQRVRARRRGAHEPAGAIRARAQAVSGRVLECFDKPRWSGPVVGCAATVGVPPLAVVAVLSGVRGQPLRVFVPWCLAGRVVRFGALAGGMSAMT